MAFGRMVGIAAVALAALACASTALAQDEVPVGESLDPVFAGGDFAFDEMDRTAPTPALPILDVARAVYEDVKASLRSLVLGFERGDAGTDAGTPDSTLVRVPERSAHVRAATPPVHAHVPGMTVPVGVPAQDVAVSTPPVSVPPVVVSIPGREVELSTPPLGVPALDLYTPPVTVSTPGVATPPVVVSLPPVAGPPADVTVEYGGAGVAFGGADGSLYLGPLVVPYHVPAVSVRADDVLPPGAPRNVTVERGSVVDEPGRTLVNESRRELLAPMTLQVLPAQHVQTPGAHVLDPMHVATLATPGAQVEAGGADVAGQTVRVTSDAIAVTTLVTPEIVYYHDEIVVADETFAVPGASLGSGPLPVDDLGYYGYGRDGDSALYPYLCSEGACVRTSTWLKPYVDSADAYLDWASGTLDGDITVAPPPDPR